MSARRWSWLSCCILLLVASSSAGAMPCDTTRVELEPDGDAVDAVTAFQQSVLDLVTHQLVGIAEERAAAVLHLDEVNLRGPAGSTGRVRLAKRVGSRLEVSYVAVVGHASEGGLKLDFRIHDGVALQSESDQQGRTGGDLVWRWKFR